MAYGTTLVVYYIRIVVFEITGFPIIIVYRVKAIGFEMIGFIIAVIKLRNFFKRIIGVYITSK